MELDNINKQLTMSTGYKQVGSFAQLCPTLQDPMDCSPPGSSVPGKNSGVGCHFLLQGSFLNQGSNPHFLCLLHWQVDPLPQRHVRSQHITAKRKINKKVWNDMGISQKRGDKLHCRKGRIQTFERTGITLQTGDSTSKSKLPP